MALDWFILVVLVVMLLVNSRLMPVTGELSASPVKNINEYSSVYSHENEKAYPGFYSVLLDRYNTNVRLSATTRSAVAQLQYKDTEDASLIFNPTASANGLRGGSILIDLEANTISGWIKGGGFCHVKSNDYVIYYYAKFDKPLKSCGVWKAGKKYSGQPDVTGDSIAAYVTFDIAANEPVTMKTGISFVSLENAKENLNIEMPGWDFNQIKLQAQAQWNQVLGKIQIEGGTKEEKTLFYTALYHSLLMPSIFDDVNGQYIGMDDQIHSVRKGHHVYSTFSGWDTYRTQAQLWGFLYPEAASDLCQTFLDTSRQTQYKGGGGLPLWSMFNDETQIMAGYPAAPFIASAYAFGAKDFDVKAITNIMIDSGKNNRYWGRNNNITWSHLQDYKKYGYYPDDCGIGHAISQNVEYAVADFSIAMMSQAIGNDEDYQYFLKRSQSIFELLHPAEKYLWARMKDGTWKENFNPFSNAGCQEGTSTHYTWGIPHNIGRLITDIGGESVAEQRLDQLLQEIAFGYDYGNPHYLAGNEPCFGVVPVYNWIGRPWKAQLQMRQVMNKSFSTEVTGIPGDDDSGAMSAWYVFAALGLYPEIPGVGGFSVTGPLFPKITLNLEGNKSINIIAQNAGASSPYIHAMKLNGDSCQQTWLTVDQLTHLVNTTLDFTMGDSPEKSWAVEYRPPSFAP